MRRVVITGMGIVSPIGNNAAEVDAALRAGTSGVVASAEMAEHGFRSQVAGTLKIDVNELINEWRREIGEVPGADSLTFRSGFFRFGDPVDVQLSGNSLETLSLVADQVKAHLAQYPTVFEIADSLSNGKEELRVEVKRQGYVLGLTRGDIIGQIGAAYRGA